MPNQSSNQTAFRTNGHRRHVYLSDLSGEIVATYAVAATPSSVSAFNVTTTLSSGASANVQHGMRVVVETAGGLPKGVLNVRSNGTISDVVLPLREVSKGQVALAVGDVLKVYDDFPLVDKLTDATANFAPDAEAYSDQYSDPKPLVGGGGHWAGWLAAAAAIPLDGSASLNLDPDTADTLTHLWAATGGTLSSTSTESPTLDLTGVATGKYRAKHTVTAANSKARVQNTRFRTHDADDPPIVGTEESPMQGDPLNGWSYSIRVYDTAAFTLSPLAPVVIWVDETINGTRQSFGAKVSGRSHIKCMGYLRRARTGYDEGEGRYYVVYDIVSALEMLRELPGFSKVFQNDATPANWNEQKTLTHKRAWLYLALYYTNANEAGHDLVLDDGGMMNKAYAAFFIQKTDPLGQWLELAAGVDCRVTCDRTGRIEVQQRLELVPFDDRGDVVTTLTLTKADIISYEMEHDFKEPVETFRARGFTAGSTGNNPLFARWPASPAYGNQSQTDEKLVCDDTTDHYERTAMRGAYANRTFTNSDRVKRHAPKMTVRLPGSYDAFDLYKEWVGLGDIDDPRVDTSIFRWLVERIGVNWESGTGGVELTLQAETNGYDAVDDTPPTEETNGLDPWTPGWGIFDPLPLTPPVTGGNFVNAGTQSLWAANEDGYGYYCGPVLTGVGFDVSSIQGGPVWNRVALSVTGTIMDSVQSAFTTSRDIIVTDDTDAIYTVDNVGSTPTVTLRKALRAGITNKARQWRQIEASFGADFIQVVSYYWSTSGSEGLWETHSLDGGTTWSTEVQVTAHYSETQSLPGLFLSSRAPGESYVGAYTASGFETAAAAEIYKFTSNFGSFASTGISLTDTLAYCIQRSFADNEQTMYYGFGNFAESLSVRAHLYRKTGSGAPVDITPNIGGNNQAPRNTRAVHTCHIDANTVLAAVTGNTTSGVVMSRDKGSTWTLLTGTTTDYNGAEVAGNNRDVGYVWGFNGAIGYVNLAAQTIDDRRGNIPVDFPGAGRFVRIRGL